MKKNEMKKNDSGAMKLAALGAGLAGLAASAYFFLGPKAKQHQKNVKAWAIKMKADVIEKLEKAKDMSEPTYNEIIDTIATGYAKSKKASDGEIKELAQDLKKHWKTISRGIKVAKNDVVKVAKKVAKK